MWNVPLVDNNLMEGREVHITLDIEAVLAEWAGDYWKDPIPPARNVWFSL